MQPIRLRLLGDFELYDTACNAVRLSGRKDLALLAYLAISDEPVDRSRMLALLWGDRAEEQARNPRSTSARLRCFERLNETTGDGR